jgi:hypothetical protein
MVAANVAPVIGAVAMRARRRVLNHFREAGAYDPATAVSFRPRRPLERRYLNSLRGFGALQEPQPGVFYLDEEKVQEHTSRRRRRALTIIGSALAAGLIVAGLGGR